MRLIKPSFSIWDQQEGLEGVYKQNENKILTTEYNTDTSVGHPFEDEIGFISETQKETQEFMSNLEKFI